MNLWNEPHVSTIWIVLFGWLTHYNITIDHRVVVHFLHTIFAKFRKYNAYLQQIFIFGHKKKLHQKSRDKYINQNWICLGFQNRKHVRSIFWMIMRIKVILTFFFFNKLAWFSSTMKQVKECILIYLTVFIQLCFIFLF